MAYKPLKVSEVNQYIKRLFSGDMILSNLKVEGEISNYKHHYSGHIYFTLKDHKAKINCVMFRSYSQNLMQNIKDGDKVVVSGYISLYEKEGSYQLYATSIEKSGIGELYDAFEKLKLKLESEGLFDPKYKKQLPFFPRKIGVVTSAVGAAVKDIITIAKRRYPGVNILIYPALVQGIYAVDSICEGLRYLDNRDDVDLIIVGRGGGSLEELFCFNDEKLARLIHSMKKPVVSAVGHETDFTIADFVADLRAPTPSAAAEMVTPETDELLEKLDEKLSRLVRSINYKINDNISNIDLLFNRLMYYSPLNKIKDMKSKQDNLYRRLLLSMDNRMKSNRTRIENIYRALSYLNPVSSVERGYGIVMDLDGNIITSVDSVGVEKELNIIIKDGIIKVKVVNIKKGEFVNEN
ncbi:MAG TPA: exodeoxyribonuclease VII large subunit [Tissierellia bacterium]|nr:exodeoxyribonuclease VII large subunit [Tissierellia bacterium]